MDLGYWIQPVQCWITNYSEFRVEGPVFEGFLSGGFGSAFIGLFPGRDRLLAVFITCTAVRSVLFNWLCY